MYSVHYVCVLSQVHSLSREHLSMLPSSPSAVYSCALLRDILLQGRLYISRNWLCFYAYLFGKDIKVSVDLHDLSCFILIRV